MNKAEVSADYLAETKRKYLSQDRWHGLRRATVIGADKTTDNIGHSIALKLRETIDIVREYNKETRCMTNTSYVGDEVLVLANGSTRLDWIENQSTGYILDVINDCLTTSILETNKFVNDTLETPGAKYIVYIGSMAYRNVLKRFLGLLCCQGRG